MKRFDWTEMQRFWELHSDNLAHLDYTLDPDGLGNVCHDEAPLWLNQYYARFQRMVYQALFNLIPAAPRGARALDVGCGAGRWCRFLAERGYSVVGIDLQPELIEANRQRFPGDDFYCTPLQEFVSRDPFDLASSVTVIQHVPFAEQDRVLRKLRKLLKLGGKAIVLENVLHQGPHVFANSVKEWCHLFEAADFRVVTRRRYDYSPFLRLDSWVTDRLIAVFHAHIASDDPGLTPEVFKETFGTNGGRKTSSLRAMHNVFKRIAANLDSLVEPVLVRANVPLGTVHCGFLLEAV